MPTLSNYRTALLLSACQTLAMSTIPMLLFVGSFIGASLAPSPELATLPLALLVVGTACGTLPMVALMKRFGRKAVFVSALIAAALICLSLSHAIAIQNFIMLCLGVTALGFALASIQQYRFAAIASVPADKAAIATSIVILSGVIAAFLGPELGLIGKSLGAGNYSGSFVLCAGVLLTTAAVMLFGFRDTSHLTETCAQPARPLSTLLMQPTLWLAVSAGAIGYALMSFIMTATPLSMHHGHGHGHSLVDTKWVIQSHLLAMFLPSLVTPLLIKHFGFKALIVTGVALYGLTVAVGLSGISFNHYWWALVALGLGWNFLFVSGTSLLPQCYQEGEQLKVQGFNDACIFSLQAIASLSAGWLLSSLGWQGVLWSSVPLLLVPVFALLANRR